MEFLMCPTVLLVSSEQTLVCNFSFVDSLKYAMAWYDRLIWSESRPIVEFPVARRGLDV